MPDITIESFVDDIAKRSNIDPAAAETAVGTILSAIQQEGNPSKIYSTTLSFARCCRTGYKKYPVVPGSGGDIGGALSGLASKVIGITQELWSPRLSKLSNRS